MPDTKVSLAKHAARDDIRGRAEFFSTENKRFQEKANPSVDDLRQQVKLLTAQVQMLIKVVMEQ